MNEIEDYQAVYDAAKRLLAAAKDRAKKSEKFREMRLDTHTIKARAAASDRLTDACFSVDQAKDYLHKTLVDAMLSKPKEKEAYETRMLEHSAGFGHSIKFKYTPPLPRCFQ